MRRAALLVVLLLVGCSVGDDDASIEATELAKLVLQPEDLPQAFVRFDEGRQIGIDSPGGRRADPSRWGRINGWKAHYRRSGTSKTPGPIVIESRADVFKDVGGAEDDLGAARADLGDSEFGWKPIDEPGLGDESFAATFVQESALTPVRNYQVVWRDDNAVASLTVNGFERKLALSDVLELARKQQRRIAHAAG